MPEIFKKAQEKQKAHYDIGRRVVSFKKEDKVLILTPFVPGKGTKKLAPLYKGPYTALGKYRH